MGSGGILRHNAPGNGIVAINAKSAGSYPEHSRFFFSQGIYNLFLLPGRGYPFIEYQLLAADGQRCAGIVTFNPYYSEAAGSQKNTLVAILEYAVNGSKI